MYYESVEAKAKQWYSEKLFCLGLSSHDDRVLGGEGDDSWHEPIPHAFPHTAHPGVVEVVEICVL